eukprot:5404338-Pleurochrysis_carterae.AAC.2
MDMDINLRKCHYTFDNCLRGCAFKFKIVLARMHPRQAIDTVCLRAPCGSSTLSGWLFCVRADGMHACGCVRLALAAAKSSYPAPIIYTSAYAQITSLRSPPCTLARMRMECFAHLGRCPHIEVLASAKLERVRCRQTSSTTAESICTCI